MNKLLIIGAGGHGRSVANVASRTKKWETISFLDDNLVGQKINGFQVIDNILNGINSEYEFDYFVAIGDNHQREHYQTLLLKKNKNVATIIDNSVILGMESSIGVGTVIMPGVIVNCNADIHMGSIINSGAVIEHDCTIGEYTHISPRVCLAGGVSIGRCTWLGIGSVIKNDIKINENIIVGAGSVVVKDLLSEGVYFGIPARRYIK